MLYVYLAGGIFMSLIILFANVAFYSDFPIRRSRLLKEMLAGFILGLVAVLFAHLTVGSAMQ